MEITYIKSGETDGRKWSMFSQMKEIPVLGEVKMVAFVTVAEEPDLGEGEVVELPTDFVKAMRWSPS